MEHMMFSSQDRYFTEKLRALRHLKPDTFLPQITAEEDKALFEELLHLPDEVQVSTWLQNNSSRRMMTIALRILIVQICSLYNYMIIASSRVLMDDYYRQMLGGFLEHSEDILPFSRKDELENSSNPESLLYSLLQEIQSLYKQAPLLTAFQARNERDQILADLLRLPENVDPIEWLKQEHEIFTIRLVLAHLLNRFNVTHGSWDAFPTIGVLKVNKVFHPLPAIRVRIKEVTFKTEGFLVQACIDFSPQGLPLSENPRPSLFVWRGFERVVDNQGYHYLTWPEEIHSGSTSFHKYQEQLTMAFYPSIAANSIALTFFSQPMIFETSALLQGGRQLHLSEIIGDDLVLHLSLKTMPDGSVLRGASRQSNKNI